MEPKDGVKDKQWQPKVTFEDLNEDILFDVIKYLPVKERLRLEAVNKLWAEVVACVWAKERGLPGIVFRNEAEVTQETLLNILRRCPNLRKSDGIYDLMKKLQSTSYATRFGADLGRLCPRLESLYIPNEYWLDIMEKYVETVVENHLKLVAFCHFSSLRMDRMVSLLKSCPQLNAVHINLKGKNIIGLKEVLPKLDRIEIYFHGMVVPRDFIETLTIWASQLSSIRFPCIPLSGKQVDMICSNLTKLKEIIFHSNFANIKYLKRLQDLELVHHKDVQHWEGSEVADDVLEDEMAFNKLLLTNRQKLKILSLKFPVAFASPSLRLLADSCPNLEKLTLKGRNHLFPDFVELSRLRKLTQIILTIPETHGKLYSGQGFRELLQECPKLRKIKFNEAVRDSVADEMISLLKRYAEQHPRTEITFFIDVVPYETSSECCRKRFKTEKVNNLQMKLFVHSDTDEEEAEEDVEEAEEDERG